MGEGQHLGLINADSIGGPREAQGAFRQRARLVGAQHVHAAEIFDRRQAPDQHPAVGQLPGPGGQRDGDDCRQQFGRHANGQSHREEQ